MQLTAFVDLNKQVGNARADIPCLEYDAALWFAESPADVEFAKSLCGACPARAGCLDGALDRQEPWGVWGGELFVHGAVVANKRPRGRPRKNAVAA
jgi:WhiB family redox-sensing transcriptional regulator